MKITNVRLYTGEETIKNGCLVTDGAFITYAGPEKNAPEDPSTLDGKGGILMPGLANSHGHAGMILMRGLGSDLNLMDWLGQVCPVEEGLTPEIIYDASRLAIAEMLKNGITCYADMYYHMGAAFQAAYDTGIRANLCRGSSGKDGVDSHREWVKTWHNADDGRIRVSMGLHAEYTSDEDTARYAVAAARELGLGMQVHLSESQGEVEGCVTRHGVRPVEYFAKMGLFDGPALAAHCVHINNEERAYLAQKGVWMAHCPASNLKLGSGIMDLAADVQAGCRICLGTDGAASNNSLDMFREMYLMALLPKGIHCDPTLTTAKDCIRIATRNGCEAMGFSDTGLLKAGWRADWTLLYNDFDLLPAADAAADIVYAAKSAHVRATCVNGRILYQNGEFATIDIEALREKCKRHAAALGVKPES